MVTKNAEAMRTRIPNAEIAEIAERFVLCDLRDLCVYLSPSQAIS
jgi:hypothetical protein